MTSQLIVLKRGHTLKLHYAAGSTVRLLAGEAWLSIRRSSSRMRAGESTAILNGDTVLIYALEDASLRLEAGEQCRVELRRRGEIAAQPSYR